MKSCGVINMKKILTFVFLLILLSLVGQNSLFASGQVNVQVETYLNSSTPSAGPAIVRNIGQKVNVTNVPEGYEFKYYAVNGIVRDDLPFEHEFNVRANMKLTVIFAPTGINERHVIVFADANGQILEVDYVVPGQDVTFDGTMPTKPQATANGFITSDGLAASLTNIQSSAVYFVNYTLTNATDYTLTVTGATKDQATYKMNEVATVTANEPDPGKVFSHFEDANGHVLSTKPVYKFTVLANTSVTAIFADEVDGPEYEGVIVNMSNAVVLRTNHVSYKGQFELPTGYELVEYGFIFSRSSDVLTLTSLGATVVPSNVHNGQTGEFLRTFPDDTFNSIRAYVTYKNGETVETVYSEHYYRNPSQLGEDGEFTYDFENISSGGYATKSFTLDSITWTVTDSYRGDTEADKKNNSYSIRIRNGILSSNAGYTNISLISFYAANYGSDTNGTFSIEVTKNGVEWIDVTDAVQSSTLLSTLELYAISLTSSLRFQQSDLKLSDSLRIRISKTGGNRINIDDLKIASSAYKGPIHEVTLVAESTSILLVQEGSVVSNPAVKTGFTFENWYTDSLFNNLYVNTGLDRSLTLYAKYNINQYSVNFNYNGANGGDMPSSIHADFDTFIDLPVPTRTGYTFLGWKNETFTTTYDDPYKITAINRNMYAHWQINTYQLQFLTGDSEINIDPIEYNFNTLVNAPIVPSRTGYSFENWYYDESFETQVTFPFNMPDKNVVLYANWIELSGSTVNVTFDSNNGDTPIIVQVNEGDKVLAPLTNPTKIGYNFVEWRLDGIAYDFNLAVNEDIVLQANWVLKTLIISATNLTVNALPNGWTHNGLGSDYSAKPKLKFDTDGDWLKTATFGLVNSATVSVFIKANVGSGTPTSTMLVFDQNNVLIYTISGSDISTTAKTVTFQISSGTTQLRFEIDKLNGNLGLDDIVITQNP